MRVGILSQWFAPESGGASIPGVLARGLVERGHEVTVLTGFPNYPTGVLYDGYSMKPREDYHEHGYAIRRVALYPNHSSRISGRLLNYGSFAFSAAAFGTSAFKGIDVLWVYNSPATVALPMWLARARYKVPIVLHIMDMWPDSVLRTGFAPRRGRGAVMNGLNAWINTMYASAEAVAYITPSAGYELKRRGVPDKKLRYAPIWVDESVFRPADGSQLRRQLGYSADDVVVGYAGALGRAQSVVELARAVVALPDSSPVKCLILGSGTEEDHLKRIAREHRERVRYLGQVPHSDMTEYCAVPDISFVGLSPDGQEAFAAPSKIPAIMACAKPILGSMTGDPAALVQASGGGVVVPPGDTSALYEALQEVGDTGRIQLHEQGQESRRFYVKELSQSVSIGRVERMLEDARLTRPNLPK